MLKKNSEKGIKKRHGNLIDTKMDELKKGIGAFLDSRVKKPALDTVDKEFSVQQNIVSILVICRNVEMLILNHGKEFYLSDSEKTEDSLKDMINILKQFIENPDGRNSKKADKITKNIINKKKLLAYLVREINWISVSILSASYISANILSRSIFELLIGISTGMTGGMSDRICSISYLSEEEQQSLKKSWKKLNAWAHPYGKWEKTICPVYYSQTPSYHPTIYKYCFENLALLTDLFLLIAVERFGIQPKEIVDDVKKVKVNLLEDFCDFFPLFFCRLSIKEESIESI